MGELISPIVDPKKLKNVWNDSDNVLIVVYENKLPGDDVKNIEGHDLSPLKELKLQKGWGFSAAIKYNGHPILFDCGWSASALKNNLKQLNIPDNQFEYIIISHNHWDHMGGLSYIADNNPQSTLLLPGDFSNHLTRELMARVNKLKRLNGRGGPFGLFPEEKCVKTRPNSLETHIEKCEFYVTGDTMGTGPIGEQAIGFKGPKTALNYIIVGCMHPGLPPLYDIISRKEGMRPDVIMGGMHGFKDTAYVKNKTDLKYMLLGHCTQYTDLFKKIEKVKVLDIYTGFAIYI
ncbi:MAG: MBL fold metallo-hydrolase [Promethearchaeota archaeon]